MPCTIYNWPRRAFEEEKMVLEPDPRPVRPRTASTKHNIDKVKKAVQQGVVRSVRDLCIPTGINAANEPNIQTTSRS